MIKELTLTLDIDEERIASQRSVLGLLGITDERADFLLTSFDRLAQESLNGATSGDVNKAAMFASFILNEPLTGNDVAFLCFAGFTAIVAARDYVKRVLSDPAELARTLASL